MYLSHTTAYILPRKRKHEHNTTLDGGVYAVLCMYHYTWSCICNIVHIVQYIYSSVISIKFIEYAYLLAHIQYYKQYSQHVHYTAYTIPHKLYHVYTLPHVKYHMCIYAIPRIYTTTQIILHIQHNLPTQLSYLPQTYYRIYFTLYKIARKQNYTSNTVFMQYLVPHTTRTVLPTLYIYLTTYKTSPTLYYIIRKQYHLRNSIFTILYAQYNIYTIYYTRNNIQNQHIISQRYI